jgi:hypothetical protein
MMETEMEMVSRHICSGEAIVAQQAALVCRLRLWGLEAEMAEELLVMFRQTLDGHYAHLARLEPHNRVSSSERHQA